MCRIAGIIDFSNKDNLYKIDGMRDAMYRGGPDDGGTYNDHEWPVSLAVRRLAILDLSSLGHQPMESNDGQVVLAFNGEIYNFKTIRNELQQKGHTFISGTDTEVVLHAWLEWGTGCFNRFNGMFGICIWDRQKQQIILARDHAGMKPLYYYFDASKKQLYFASEIRAFKQMNPFWAEDDDWRVYLLSLGHIPEPHTTLKNVKALPMGHLMVVDIPSFETKTQQWLNFDKAYIYDNEKIATEKLQQTLQAAVERHLVADAPIGLFLSGGIDSSILTLLAAKIIPDRLHTISLVFEEAQYSEKKFQDMVVKKSGAAHYSHTISRREFEDSMPDILNALDMPSTDGINSYFISKYSRAAGLKAVLSGVGADELFGGYESFRRRNTVLKLRTLPNWILAAAAKIPQEKYKRISYLKYPGPKAEFLFYRGGIASGIIAKLLDMEEKEVAKILISNQPEKEPAIQNPQEYISRMEQDYYMRNQLFKDLDFMSMWHSVEVRVPFLDRELIELCAQTIPSIRFKRGRPKQWLIDSFSHILPKEVWNRKKMGFSFPFNSWLKSARLSGACDKKLFDLEEKFAAGKINWSSYWAYLQSTCQPIKFTPPVKRILFIALRTFSSTGGIEKFNRSFSKALMQNAQELHWQVTMHSGYDAAPETKYFLSCGFRGFKNNKLIFAWETLKILRYYDVVIAGHINLSPLLAFTRRTPKFIMIAHGIEVWKPLSLVQKNALHLCKNIWCVSRFTASKVVALHNVPEEKIKIFPNTLDPFFSSTAEMASKEDELKTRFNSSEHEKILLTITRLDSTEHYKGYDEVLKVIPNVRTKFPNIKYIIGGKADAREKERLLKLIEDFQLQDVVILTGFITEEELPSHYKMADIFVMPSRKEGFGIVFIEAAWWGLPVIGGNQDGSVDALLDGKLGTLVNPTDNTELEAAILAALSHHTTESEKAAKRKMVEMHFGFNQFTARQAKFLQEI